MDIGGTTIDDVMETFQLFDDWEDRYRYVIELGGKMAPLADEAHSPENKVRGCMSQVWFQATKSDDNPPRLLLEGDSDAMIVKGLIAILFLMHSGKTPDEILAVDSEALLGELDLAGHLTPMRTNGLFSMLKRIRQLAATAR